MGRLCLINLEGKIYSCKHCQTHLGLYEDIVSKSFHCRHGKAYLFNKEDLFHKIQLHLSMRMLNDVCWKSNTHHGFLLFLSLIQYSGPIQVFVESVNVSLGEKEDRQMMTGMHTVADIFCIGCGSIVGWKYEAAHEKGQKYKEGKFILERYKVSGPDGSHYWANHEAQVGGSDADDA